jgi:hypothetical protein
VHSQLTENRHSIRRAALRSALSASRTVSTQTRIAPIAARTAEQNVVRIASAQSIRFFTQTVRKASQDEKELEEAQRKAEQDFDRQAATDARQDVEVRFGVSAREAHSLPLLTLIVVGVGHAN